MAMQLLNRTSVSILRVLIAYRLSSRCSSELAVLALNDLRGIIIRALVYLYDESYFNTFESTMEYSWNCSCTIFFSGYCEIKPKKICNCFYSQKYLVDEKECPCGNDLSGCNSD